MEGQFVFPTHQPARASLVGPCNDSVREVRIPKFIPEKREEYGAALDLLMGSFVNQVSNGEIAAAAAADRLL
jgi:hypothetical protein